MHAEAVHWAETAWARRVTTTRRLTGGSTSTMLSLTAADGEQAVLRLMTEEPWRRHAPGLLTREATVQHQLAGEAAVPHQLALDAAVPRRLADAPIPAPRSIAVDPAGEAAGVPAHLMSRLSGRLCLDSAADAVLRPLARLLARIHRFDPGAGRPREYQSWAPPAKRLIPPWARNPALWERAFEVLDRPAPAYAGRFLHRDFHLGNVLWSRGTITGVVDWVETSWGPAELDVAHAATYLAMLHGPAAAARFKQLYGTPAESPYWQIMDIVGYLPDPAKVARPWRDCGVAVSDELARDRLERWLQSSFF